MSEATAILQSAQGASENREQLLLAVYEDLRNLARAKMAHERPGHTLQATALVHEAWLRLSQQENVKWKSREHFYAVAAEAMRRILVDRARRRLTRKHGGDWKVEELDEATARLPIEDEAVVRVSECLERLARSDPEKAEIVKLRFFVGLENGEIGEILGVSEKTVQRHWAFAKAWLARAMERNA